MTELLQIRDLIIDKAAKERKFINLSLKQGEIHAVMGEAGAGKSGIAHILAGLQQPATGIICINGRSVQILNPRQAIKLGIGVLFEGNNYGNAPGLTVKEYLYLWSNKFIVSNNRLHEMARRLLEDYEVEIDPDRLFSSLNQEEQHFISFMRVLACNSKILVLDEPTFYLSEFKKHQLFRVLRKYVEKQNGVIYLSNQLDEILQIGDQVTILKDNGTLEGFPIEYARKKTDEILSLYFGRKTIDNISNNSDEFKDVIDTLLHTTELLTSEYELQDLLHLLVEKITDATKADLCSILLFDEDSTKVVECFRHLRSNLPEIELNDEIVRKVISSGDTLIKSNLTEYELHNLINSDVNIKSIICVPIPVRSKINGIIEVFYTRRIYFEQEDIEILKTFATQVAIAIENTRLLGRSTLLKEAHHRIKNNLQSIISLLLLQLQSKSEKGLNAIIWEIIDRIKTIASVHEILSEDEKSIGLINFRNLVNIIASNYNEKYYQNMIAIEIEITDIYVSYKTATSLGLVVNELLANCFEHAFCDGRKGRIKLMLKHDDKNIQLKVMDNGIGFDKDISQLDTLGISLIKNLVKRDLRGTIDYESDKGTCVTITFPKHQINY